ncbi:MAG: serine--tRNA ligase [Chloroflexi bacterium]|nr:serine--tRNA ligase [Chloroflexota bacterium]
MLNVELLRREPAVTQAALARRGPDAAAAFDRAVQVDRTWRDATTRVDALRAERNQRSGAIRGKPTPEQLEAMRALREQTSDAEQRLHAIELERDEALGAVPNVPDASVPDGVDDSDNVVVRTWGEPPAFPHFEPLPHWELGARLGILDMEAGARLSGARFYVLRGYGAALERALINFMLDLHVREQGYTELAVPYLVREEIMYSSGQLPKFRNVLYHDDVDNLWLIPTSEVALVNYYNGEIIPPDTLPLKLTAATPCFRREQVAAGRDVRGIKRVKQFDKVEMVRFVEPEGSMGQLEALVADAELVFQQLGLPYQVTILCTGDLGFAMAKTYDINCWAAGSQEWLECSSCSNANDYQARRANIRFRRQAGGRTEYPHTLNGSGVGLPRTLIAVLENNQQADGSVIVPPVLRPYLGGLERLSPP